MYMNVLSFSQFIKNTKLINNFFQLVKKLSKDAKLTKCPLCERSCEIITPDTSQTFGYKKDNTPPRKCLFDDSQSPIKIKKSSSLQNSNSVLEFSRVNRSNSLPYNIRSSTNAQSSTSSGRNSIDDNLFSSQNNSINFQDYSMCSRCNYKFCASCHCACHPYQECTIIDSYSPSREEEKPLRPSIIGSKQSKKNLKRL